MIIKKLIDESNGILLVEPMYRRKYPPFGLMKIKSACEFQGKDATFTREPIQTEFNTIFVTTLFTYDYEICIDTIMSLKFLNPDAKIVVGGVAASVNPSKFQLDDSMVVFSGYSDYIDSFAPCYKTDWLTDEAWLDWSFAFTTRGCPNNCAYCFVPKIETGLHIVDGWERAIQPDRKKVMIYDNNMTALGHEHVGRVADRLADMKKKCRLDNAVDCKYITPEMAAALKRLPLDKRGLRTAFDRIEEDGVFQEGMKLLMGAGISKYNIMAYVLYNFNDTPKEADYRARECANLGIVPYPACFQPVNSFDRSSKYISKQWTKKLSTAFTKFWLYASLYSKMEFEDYIHGDGFTAHKLGPEDLLSWKG